MKAIMFEVGKSLIHGKGLFAQSPIPARRKLGELDGEVITQNQARRRTRNSKCIMMVEFGDGTALDASRAESSLKYINHSCTPNTFTRLFRRRVEFYSLRRIAPGEEITCDYGETHHEGTLLCRCRSSGCRGRL
jgi:uncharacterized protein